jgi:hypothetical protein
MVVLRREEHLQHEYDGEEPWQQPAVCGGPVRMDPGVVPHG